ncbi:hypothetical protein UT300003_15410 [Clostridium sardiniense]
MKSIAISQVLEQMLNVLISLLFAVLLVRISIPLGSAGGTVGTSMGAIISILYLMFIYEKNKRKEDYDELLNEGLIKTSVIRRKLFRYAFPIILSATIQNLGGLIDMMNVNLRLLDSGFSVKMSNILYGYLYYYKVLTGVPLIVVTAIGTIILTSISNAYALRNKKVIAKNIDFSFRLTLAITIPSAIGLAVLSNEVYLILFKGQGHELMLYGSTILVFMAIAQIQGVILQGISEFSPMIISFTIGIVIKIIANYILVGIHSINIYGVLIGNLLMYIIPTLINKRLKHKMMTLNMIIKPIISGLIMGAALFTLKIPINLIKVHLNLSGSLNWGYTLVCLIILVGIGTLLYGYIMVVIGGIRKSDIEVLPIRIYNMIPKFLKKRIKDI